MPIQADGLSLTDQEPDTIERSAVRRCAWHLDLVEEVLIATVNGRYAGDVLPEEAFESLRGDANAVLIDVRTRAEWGFVGVPDLASCNKAAVLVEWQRYPTMEMNETFVIDVEKALNEMDSGDAGLDDSGVNTERSLFFLCRSGVRSVAAAEAMAGAGYLKSFNVTEGFEGSLDVEGHRGVGGWKARGLPWVQK